MKTHLVATNAFTAFLWLIMTILLLAVVGPGLANGSEDPADQASGDALLTAMVTASVLIMLGYVAAAVGTGVEQPWGHGVTMLMMPLTLLVAPIAVWQIVVLVRHPA